MTYYRMNGTGREATPNTPCDHCKRPLKEHTLVTTDRDGPLHECPLSALEMILTMRPRGQCPSQYATIRGRDMSVTFCGLREGHEGHHVGPRKRWDSEGRLVKKAKAQP